MFAEQWAGDLGTNLINCQWDLYVPCPKHLFENGLLLYFIHIALLSLPSFPSPYRQYRAQFP